MITILKNIRWRDHALELLFLLICSAILLFTYLNWQESKARYSTLKAQNDQLRARNNIAFAAQQTLNNIEQRYDTFSERGIIHSPEKLQWIETLQALTSEFKLPRVEFTLGEQERLMPQNSAYYSEGVETTRTQMNITADLLHEGDFFNFYHQLLTQGKGLYIVDNCFLRRIEKTKVPRAFRPMTSNCKIYWYNIAPVITLNDTGEDYAAR